MYFFVMTYCMSCTCGDLDVYVGLVMHIFPILYGENSQSALEPIMSQETLEYHWGKHHRTYVDNLNRQIDGTDLDGNSLEDTMVILYNKGDILPAFNNAAQACMLVIIKSY